MSILANSSQKTRALGAPQCRSRAPTPGRSSLSQKAPRILQATIWSLLPGAIGLVLALLLADHFGWALLVFAAHQITAWALMLRTGRSARLERSDWICIALGTGLTILLGAPSLFPWLLLPVIPALLLRSACRHGPPPRVVPVMRIFSIASLAAVLMQLAGDRPGIGVLVAVLGATVMGLTALERLVVPDPEHDQVRRDLHR